jgi:DUF971 family protein
MNLILRRGRLCAQVIIMQTNGEFDQALGADGEVGALAEVEVLKTNRDGHYDIRETWADGRTHIIYRWRGSRYFFRLTSQNWRETSAFRRRFSDAR